MGISPSINTNVRGISFPVIMTDSSPTYTTGVLADSTGGVVYRSGVLLAQYTSGPNVGKFVNYDSVAGTNGQNVFVGVLNDDLMVNGTTVSGTVQIVTQCSTKGGFYKSALIGTQSADIAAAITQQKARVIYDYNISGQYLVLGLL